MKISILLEAFQPEYWGGRETRWSNLILELSRHHQITVFADFSRTPSQVAFPNVDIRCVNIGELPKMYTRSGSRSLKHALFYSVNARKIIHEHADVLLTDQTPLIFMPLIWLYSKMNKSKFSVVWHEFWDYDTWSQYSKSFAPAGLFIQNYAILFSGNIVVPSERVKKQIIVSKPKKNVRVIQNGFQVGSPSDLIYGKDSKKKREEIELLFVGRLIKHKNVEFLISVMSIAVSQNFPWHLTIVGSGPLREKLNSLVQSLDLEKYITFKSNVESLELEEIYSSSNIFVFPSEREGYGISVAEALMHNLPVVLLDVFSNASADLITGFEMGRKIGELDETMWIDAISQLSNTELQSISLKFQESQKSWAQVAEEYEKFLENIIATH
jgi:glycosyltransferase involved in cell wall biosynthesis